MSSSQTPTTGPSAPETTSELREALAPFASAAEWLEGCQTVHISSPDQAGVMHLGIKAFQRAHTVFATPTTPPPAGDVAALRALSEKATPGPWPHVEHDNSDTSAAEWWLIPGIASHFCSEADAKLARFAVNYVRTHVLPAQTTTAAAPGSEGGVEGDIQARIHRYLAAPLGQAEHPTSLIRWISAALARRSAPATGGAAQLADTIGKKLAEPAFAAFSETLRGNLTEPGHLLAFKVRPTGTDSMWVRLASGREIIVGEDEWVPATATGGAARLDREAVARVIEPTIWAAYDAVRKRYAGVWRYPEEDQAYFADQIANTLKRRAKSLSVADAILALDPAPKSQAASEEVLKIAEAVREVVREAWVLLDNTSDGGEPEQDIEPGDWGRLSAAAHELEALIPAEEQPCSIGHAVTLLIAAITPADRGTDAAEPIKLGCPAGECNGISASSEVVARLVEERLKAEGRGADAGGWRPEDVSPPEALYAWLLRHYEETDPTKGEGFQLVARKLVDALAEFIEAEMPAAPTAPGEA